CYATHLTSFIKTGYLMDWESIFKISTGFLASVGSAGVIIFGLSSWLGKVWAQRILDEERHKLAEDLEATKVD
ncbi:hypothetical protein FCV67_26055, partial [Vibrio sp. F13]